jgi:hypothetical protein
METTTEKGDPLALLEVGVAELKGFVEDFRQECARPLPDDDEGLRARLTYFTQVDQIADELLGSACEVRARARMGLRSLPKAPGA